jgi:catechol 2,3-dioxygenase-like lactoylglutathione lyase family enzyme
MEAAMTLNHVHIGTKNLQASCTFYETYFGFKKKFDHAPGVFLENKEGFLLAIDPVESVPTFPNWYHLGFCLKSEAQVLEIYEKMKASGVSLARDLAAEKNQFASFFVFDPDNYKIEVSWHNE